MDEIERNKRSKRRTTFIHHHLPHNVDQDNDILRVGERLVYICHTIFLKHLLSKRTSVLLVGGMFDVKSLQIIDTIHSISAYHFSILMSNQSHNKHQSRHTFFSSE